MSDLTFFDTNIIIYTDDESSLEKHSRADALFREHRHQNTAVISLQVMQEYYSAATRKLRMPVATAQLKVEILSRCRVVEFHAQDVIAAIELHRLSGLSLWDALIVHAARISGCAVLYSEDLQHRSAAGGVRVINPFVES